MQTTARNQKPDSDLKFSTASQHPRSRPIQVAALFAAFVFLLFGTTSARADQRPANCTGSGLGIHLFTSSADVHVGDTLFYSVNVFNGITNRGGRIVCDATGIAAFIVTPDLVPHPITRVRTFLSGVVGTPVSSSYGEKLNQPN